MVILNVLGGMLVGNGLCNLWLGAARSHINAHFSVLEVVVGGIILLVRAFQLGYEAGK